MIRNTLFVCSSNRLMERQTSSVLQELLILGAPFCEKVDIGDVSLARNLALTSAIERLQDMPHVDTVFMFDDDMVFDVARVERLTAYAREHKVPVSGVYVLGNARPAVRHLQGNRWLTGLGCLCLHRDNLFELAIRSPKFRPYPGATTWAVEFTKSCADRIENGELCWENEDYRLTRALGGAALLPIAFGHVKKQIMWPNPDKLEQFIAEEEGKNRP